MFYNRWIGPDQIDIVYDNGSINLYTIDKEKTPLMENGHRLRLYQKPKSREEFIQDIVRKIDF